MGLFALEGRTGDTDSRLRIRSHEGSSLEVCGGDWIAPWGPPWSIMVPDDSWESLPVLRGCCADCGTGSEFPGLCTE